jgi:hypothetical protein
VQVSYQGRNSSCVRRGPLYAQLIAVAGTLDDYNNGELCP